MTEWREPNASCRPNACATGSVAGEFDDAVVIGVADEQAVGAVAGDARGFAAVEPQAVAPAIVVTAEFAHLPRGEIENTERGVVGVGNNQATVPPGNAEAVLQPGPGEVTIASSAFEQPGTDQRFNDRIAVSGHGTHRRGLAVDKVESAGGAVEGEAGWLCQVRFGAGAVSQFFVATAGECRDLAGAEIEAAQLVGPGIGEEKPVVQALDVPNRSKAGIAAGGWPVKRRSALAGASQRPDCTGGQFDVADRMIAGVGDVDALCVTTQALRAIEGTRLAVEIKKAGLPRPKRRTSRPSSSHRTIWW